MDIQLPGQAGLCACACRGARAVLFADVKEPENAGVYLGFIAAAIGSNPANAEQLLFPVLPEDERVIVRAIAYLGLPEWRIVLRWVAPRMPGRRVVIDSYLAGKPPNLTDIPLEQVKPRHDRQAARGLQKKSCCQG